MSRGQEWLIGGVLSLIISIGYSVMTKRISAASVATFILFLYGVYRAMKEKSN